MTHLIRRCKPILLPLATVGASLVFVAALFHLAFPPVYHFPEARPFSGPNWHNPYAVSDGIWLKTNLHAHSRSWGGLARGSVPAQTLFEQYRRIGYDVVGISNYQSIRAAMPGEPIYVSAYEHGFGVWQQHQTVVGVDAVSWLDFPFYQGIRQKQCILDHLDRDGALVIVNHPNKAGSYGQADMSRLTGYTGLELASKYARGIRGWWDAALSAGRRVWGFCSDDRDNIERLRVSGTGWIMVQVQERTPAAVLEAIRRGQFYGVWARQNRIPIAYERCEIDEGVLRVRYAEPAETIRFIGQHGTLRKEVKGQAEADYLLRPDDPYIRVEAATRKTTLFLNPVWRHDGDPLAYPRATAAAWPTWALRSIAAIALIAGAALLLVFYRGRRRTGASP